MTVCSISNLRALKLIYLRIFFPLYKAFPYVAGLSLLSSPFPAYNKMFFLIYSIEMELSPVWHPFKKAEMQGAYLGY